MFRRSLIVLSNAVVRRRRIRLPSDQVLLLASHCLQRTACGRRLGQNGEACERCGQCNISDLLTLRDEFGVTLHVAAGGRQALAEAKLPEFRAIVAVACERELVDGIVGAFPKPVLAIRNTRPSGPCTDTQMDPEEVRQALAHFTDGKEER